MNQTPDVFTYVRPCEMFVIEMHKKKSISAVDSEPELIIFSLRRAVRNRLGLKNTTLRHFKIY